MPISTAFAIVMQGIRIRLGRSMVTLLGVVFGIAFLMSILTSESIKEGVAKETSLRTELGRMTSFLSAETGPLEGRAIAVYSLGAPNEVESRFFQSIARETGRPLAWVGVPAGLPAGVAVPADSLEAAAEDAVAVLVTGGDTIPAGTDFSAAMAVAHQKVLASTRTTLSPAAPEGASFVQLERELKEDEIAAAEKEAKKAAFRSGWITIISLLVTVIGISNAMLMSVTERFREIGTMKCLGALSSFIRTMFFLEASLLGAIGSLAGGLFGFLFSFAAYSFTFGVGLVASVLNPLHLLSGFLMSMAAGIVLSVVAAIYPARFASKMIPATALRSTI
ncbi:MAG: ABC transporter permease [Kiritimatiellia bacterium]